MRVAEAVGRTLAGLGVRQAFGVVGSGNFDITNALIAGGARYVAARHEGGAATMADAYTRMSGEVAALTLHQGCGLTNAMTGITEAAKSRTPLIILAGEATAAGSNFAIDQPALAHAVGAEAVRVSSADTAVDEAIRAFHLARDERRTVLVNLPLEVQAAECPAPVDQGPGDPPAPVEPAAGDVDALAALLAGARRPVLIAGRGARHARAGLLALGDASGALLATSAVAKGLFNGSPWSLDVSGGFASPLAAELIGAADVVVGFGCALNMWTTRHGRLIGSAARVAQVDLEAAALGRHQQIDLGVVGDSATTATAVTDASRGRVNPGYRDQATQARAPLFDHAPFELRGRPTPDGHGAELWAVTPNGTVAMSSQASFA